MNRLSMIAGHVGSQAQPAQAPRALSAAPVAALAADDIVVVSALRTPIGKAKRGAFKTTPPEELLSAVLKATMERTGIDPTLIGDITVGNCLQGGAGALAARTGMLIAGLPHDVPCSAVNRQCSSGLQAFANVAGAIAAGQIDVGIACGVESMSVNTMMDSAPKMISDQVMNHPTAINCLLPMGITSENVAEKYGISKEQQNRLAFVSHEKALAAIAEGKFKDEIVAVTTKEGIVVDTDEGPRKGTTFEKLMTLKAAFKEGGTTTAGNSSQVSDGAAAVLTMKRSKAKELGLPVIGCLRGFSVVGVDPEVMGIGPAVAIPSALAKAGMSVADIDVYEINEAFASQAAYCVQKLGIPMAKVNPLGGAIALGHPLGCTGARQIATLLHQLKRTGQKSGVVSMCIGTGMGAAAVFTSE